MTGQSEVELKLELAPADVDALLASPLLTGAGERADQHSMYFDTADQALRRAGASLRSGPAAANACRP